MPSCMQYHRRSLATSSRPKDDSGRWETGAVGRLCVGVLGDATWGGADNVLS